MHIVEASLPFSSASIIFNRRVWIVFCVLYVVYGTAGCWLVSNGAKTFFFGYAVMAPVVMISGLLPVFGSSRLWIRLLVGNLLGIILLVAGAVSLFSFGSTSGIFDSYSGENFPGIGWDLLEPMSCFALLSFPVVLAGQLPAFVASVFLRWRVGPSEQLVASRYFLIDVIAFTAIVAVALACPRMAMSVLFEFDARSIVVGEEVLVENGMEDHTGKKWVKFELKTVTQRNIEDLKDELPKQNFDIVNSTTQSIIVRAGFALSIGFLFLIQFWAALKIRNHLFAWVSTFAMACLGLWAFFMLVSLYRGVAIPNWGVESFKLPVAWAFISASTFALLTLRTSGVRLVACRRSSNCSASD